MPKRGAAKTPGQKLWLGLYLADQHEQGGDRIELPAETPRLDSSSATKRWLEGMAGYRKERFRCELRARREELDLTQKDLAELSDLTVTAVAMIERGERTPNLDTAARLCWALDLAAGVTSEDV